MEQGVIENVASRFPIPTIADIVCSEKSYTRSTHWEGILAVPFMYAGNRHVPEYPIAYDRFFKEANGTPRQESHDFRILFPQTMYALPLLTAYPHQAIEIIVEKNVVKSPPEKRILLVTDLEPWLAEALRRKLPTRVRKGVSSVIQGL